jgi:Tfp pilus assembly protein PilF
MSEERISISSKTWLHIAVALAFVISVSGCSTLKKSLQSPVNAPPAADADPTAARIQHALELLQNGDSHGADVELHAYLKAAPGNKSALYLVAQIETPLSTLFTRENFTVKVARDETLASLARTYLGNSLAFYGLARYNEIAVPSKVGEGQSIRIPKTVEALQALARVAALPAVPQAPSVAPTSSDVTPIRLAEQRKLADEYYKRGLVAFQHQDLDAAIAAWDKALFIDPNYKNAQLSRAQAIRLKSNLAKLRK